MAVPSDLGQGATVARLRYPLPVTALALAVTYAVGSMVSYMLIDLSEAGAAFFPAAGVSLAALVLSPKNRWPVLLLTIAATEFTIDVVQGHSTVAAMCFAVANSVEPLVGAALLMWACPTGVDLSRRRDVGRFVVFAVIAGPLVGGLIGGSTIAALWGLEWWHSVASFWAGDAMGVLTVGATILTWRQLRERARVIVLAGFGSAIITTLAFSASIPIAYLSAVPLIWMAFNTSVAALCAGGLGMTLAANLMTSLGYGTWAVMTDNANVAVASLQLFLATAVLSAWLLAIGIREREIAFQRYERERLAATELQRALLPDIASDVAGVKVSAIYRPGDERHEVGGDWYDVFVCAPGTVALVVGDIVGHGLPAAASMGSTHAVLRMLAQQPHASAGEVLSRLDEACVAVPGAAFATVGYAEFRPETMRLEYACAGHPPPLLVDHTGARFLWDGRSTPIAVAAESRPSGSMTLTGQMRLVWYSDGLIERPTVRAAESLENLRCAVSRLDLGDSPQAWCDRLVEVMIAEDVADDIVVLCADLASQG